jgi:hypothetical protein
VKLFALKAGSPGLLRRAGREYKGLVGSMKETSGTDALEGPGPVDEAAAIIRRASEAGLLISEAEIRRALAGGQPGAEADREADVRTRLLTLLGECDDLREVVADNGERSYYSSLSMSEAYAALLLRRQGDPARLIAEIVRQDSEVYPRPVPLDMFTHPPFDFTLEEVVQTAAGMAAREEYSDIEETRTSTARLFLYSTLYLEPAYASMLAEWLDVGQSNNP